MQDVVNLTFGLLCKAPRGGGWCGENHKHIRRELGAVIFIKSPPFPSSTELRVQFHDGTAHWIPIQMVSYCDAQEERMPL